MNSQSLIRRMLLSLALWALVGGFAGLLSAQERSLGEGRTAVSGSVHDPSRSAVAGASVTLSRADGFRRQVETDAEGGFAFDDVEPGLYNLSVSANAFARR